MFKLVALDPSKKEPYISGCGYYILNLVTPEQLCDALRAHGKTLERLEVNFWSRSRSKHHGRELPEESEFPPLLHFINLQYLSIEDERFVRFEQLPPNLRALVIKQCNLYRNKGKIYPQLRKLRQYCPSIQNVTIEYYCADVLARAEAAQLNKDDMNQEFPESRHDTIDPLQEHLDFEVLGTVLCFVMSAIIHHSKLIPQRSRPMLLFKVVPWFNKKNIRT